MIYVISAGGMLLGIILHLVIALQTINKATPKADFTMLWKQYWETDYLAFVISILVCCIFLYTMSEWLEIGKLDNPEPGETAADRLLHFKFSAFVKTVSIGMGYFADYFIFKVIGRTKKIIDKKLDDS
jgi:hypothetical protein